MTARGVPSRGASAAIAAALLLGTAALAGCANASYAGVPLAVGAADPELQALAGRARGGDQHAQFELGIRYEEGRGVPVDLDRARSLYFKAATGRSHHRTVMHLPGPKGGRVHRLPGRVEYSGLGEALLRWHKLGERAAGALQPSVSAGPDAAQPLSPRPLAEDPSYHISTYQGSILNYGYHPVFQNLKSVGKDWRVLLRDSDPITVLTPFTVDNSLLLATLTSPPARSGAQLDEARARSLCEPLLRSVPEGPSATRLFGLCAFKYPPQERIVHRAAAQAAGRLAAAPAFDRAFYSAASEAVYLQRVANRPATRNSRRGFSSLLSSIDKRLGGASRKCGASRCAGETGYLFRRLGFVGTQLMFAILEDPGLLPSAGPAELEAFRKMASLVATDEPWASSVAQGACVPLGMEPQECRGLYPYEPGLDQFTARTIARFVAGSGGAANCARLQARLAPLASELMRRPDLQTLVNRFVSAQCGSVIGRP